MIKRATYWILSGSYGCYFAALGGWLPYWPLYLTWEGHGPEVIGILTATAQGIKIVAPPAWGWLADHLSRRWVTISSAFLTFALFSLYGWRTDLSYLFWVTLLFGFCQSGPMFLVETTTLETVFRGGGDYGRIRVWGSLGFILFSLGLGPIVDHWGIELLIPAVAGFFALGAVLSLRLPTPEPVRPSHDGASSPPLLAHAGLRWFYLSSLLMQISHGAYYGFMSIHLAEQGYSKSVIGLLWALGVLAEVGLLAHSRRLLAHFGLSFILTLSLALASVRWAICAVTWEWIWLIPAQLLHAFTFGAFHVAAVRRVFESAPSTARATAQAWYAAISFGLGASVGLFSSGFLYRHHGAAILFAVMAGVAALGVLASWRSALLYAASPPISVEAA